MERVSSIAIVGAGASGCVCAYYLLKAGLDVILFDYSTPLRTLLATGGGRCNLAHAEYDFKELAKNYPRGEKFLYSVFSQFSTYETLALFKELGVETYAQDDGRIFPVSNSSAEVRKRILQKLENANFINEKVLSINDLEGGFKLKTNKSEYFFSDVVIAIGGAKKIDGIKNEIVPFKPSLVGLNSNIKNLSGVILKDVFSKDFNCQGDMLFTHFGISGPLIYKISSLKAFDKFPYKLVFDMYPKEMNLQEKLNSNPHKDLKNIFSEFFPHRFAEFIAGSSAGKKAHTVNGKIRDEILAKIHNFELTITGANKGEETVTAGGYDLTQINSKTMESKIQPHLFFAGEALNIDGFCGGFNLQNAWSTAYVASQGIINY